MIKSNEKHEAYIKISSPMGNDRSPETQYAWEVKYVLFQQSRAGNSKENSSLWPILPICKVHEDWIKIKRLRSGQGRICFFYTQGQVSLNWIVWSCQNLNLSKILCLSRLFESFIKIQLPLNRLFSGHGQIWCFSELRAINSEVNCPIWPKFELIWDSMPVHVISNFHNDWIKTKRAMLRTRSNIAGFSAFEGK